MASGRKYDNVPPAFSEEFIKKQEQKNAKYTAPQSSGEEILNALINTWEDN